MCAITVGSPAWSGGIANSCATSLSACRTTRYLTPAAQRIVRSEVQATVSQRDLAADSRCVGAGVRDVHAEQVGACGGIHRLNGHNLVGGQPGHVETRRWILGLNEYDALTGRAIRLIKNENSLVVAAADD